MNHHAYTELSLPSVIVASNTLFKQRITLAGYRTRNLPILSFHSSVNESTKCVACSCKAGSSAEKFIDVTTLGNLCVDVVLSVPSLPPPDFEARKHYMEQLSSTFPDRQCWEAGGNCNMAIAAARLGLTCATIGHVGGDAYGKFLVDVLLNENIKLVGIGEGSDVDNYSSHNTPICWVLVDSMQRHSFCSRADLNMSPALDCLTKLSDEAFVAIEHSRILFCNGYGFDELLPGVITSAVNHAIRVGTSVFFDPGPRGRILSKGTVESQQALAFLLKMSNVLLVTADEAESLTGISNPILAGQHLLSAGICTRWVIVKMGSRGSILITNKGICCAPAFKVNVVDTVGCGDSFVAAIAFGFIRNLPAPSTLTVANAVGGATATGRGAGRNVATLDKITQVMKEADIYEDDGFWYELVSDSGAHEITLLSNVAVNQHSPRLTRFPLDTVISRLLSELESEVPEKCIVS